MSEKRNKYKGFLRIDKTLNQTAKHYNLETALYRGKILKHWDNLVGSFIEQAKELSKPVDLKKGVLVIACLSREVAFQIKLLAQRIISALNELLGRQVVFAISFEL